MIYQGPGNGSIADADRAKWDYNHVMEAPFVMPEKAGLGRFYFGTATNDFQVMVKYMKSYVAKRTRYVDSQLLSATTRLLPRRLRCRRKVISPSRSSSSRLNRQQTIPRPTVAGAWRKLRIRKVRHSSRTNGESMRSNRYSSRRFPALNPESTFPPAGSCPVYLPSSRPVARYRR